MSEQNITTNELAERLGKLEELILRMNKNSEGNDSTPDSDAGKDNPEHKDTIGVASRTDGFKIKNGIEFPHHDEDGEDESDVASSSATITGDELASFGIGVGVGAALLGGGLLIAKLFSKD